MKRPPANPPDLPGYRPISHLGSGGFADVFLYQQELPHREVAVKVLLESVVNSESRQRFVGEANAMARLSAHPSIVTIHFAGISPDGRPCLVMEYCPRPNLGIRMRKERIAIDEALRIGVRLASAVETAHRAGILHRDIKPANVLVTAYNWPKLTDFGIAAQLDTHSLDAEGMSVPWSAPELFAPVPQSDVRTDVYALGATVYGLLAGRAPFEVRGGNNSAASLIARTERDPVPPTGRDEVPDLLQQTLARSMHKRAEARYRNAYDFARALRVVEAELGLPQTPIEVLDTVHAQHTGGDDPAATNVRSVVTINDEPGLQLAEDSTGGAGDGRDTPQRPVAPQYPVGGDADHTAQALGPVPDSTNSKPRRLTVPIVLGLVGVAVLAAVVAGVVVWGPGASVQAEPTAQPTDSRVIRQRPIAPPDEGRCTRDGRKLTCTWTQPNDDAAGWTWRLVANPEKVFGTVDEPTATITLPDETTAPCISVVAYGESGSTSEPVTMCAS